MTSEAGHVNADALRHSHDYGRALRGHERRTRWVVGLTFGMMILELVVGYATNSLALMADGWHMATHAGALGMAALAYAFARRHAHSSEFTFGTGKVHALAGYTSAVALALVALLMIVESIGRLFRPEAIAFSEALPVAILGLCVNLASAWLLHDDEHHHAHDAGDEHHEHHGPERHDHHDHGPADHNLHAARLHVLADALTSVLAILALLGGRFMGWSFLDPVMGIVGGAVIARWSYALCRRASRQLLDMVPSEELVARIRTHVEATLPGTKVVDLHLWEVAPAARACVLSVATTGRVGRDRVRDAVAAVQAIEHVTIEIHDASFNGRTC